MDELMPAAADTMLATSALACLWGLLACAWGEEGPLLMWGRVCRAVYMPCHLVASLCAIVSSCNNCLRHPLPFQLSAARGPPVCGCSTIPFEGARGRLPPLLPWAARRRMGQATPRALGADSKPNAREGGMLSCTVQIWHNGPVASLGGKGTIGKPPT